MKEKSSISTFSSLIQSFEIIILSFVCFKVNIYSYTENDRLQFPTFFLEKTPYKCVMCTDETYVLCGEPSTKQLCAKMSDQCTLWKMAWNLPSDGSISEIQRWFRQFYCLCAFLFEKSQKMATNCSLWSTCRHVFNGR